MESRFFRDASNRLAHSRTDIDSHSFAEVCKKIADHFELKQSSDLIVGPEQMLWDFADGVVTVELAWDIWLCFTVTAKEPDAEQLVRQIVSFLSEAVPSKLDS